MARMLLLMKKKLLVGGKQMSQRIFIIFRLKLDKFRNVTNDGKTTFRDI